MAHVRQQIRQAVTADLVAAATPAGSNVHASRVRNLAAASLPALLVYMRDETVEPVTMKPPRRMRHEAELVIEAIAQHATNVDDQLDALSVAAEAVIAADPKIGGLAKDATLAAVETETEPDAETPVGVLRMVFATQYETAEGDQESAI